MGRAARRKRERRVPRTWQTRNPWTGALETFPVCIDDEALHEWERHRVRLAAAGYPDRPPDFDSPNLRVWGTVPGTPVEFDPAAAGEAVLRLGADREARGIGAWRSCTDELAVKVNVGRRDDGTFVLEFVLETLTDHAAWTARVADAEAAHAAIEEFGRTVLPALGLPPFSWISDEALLAEIADAA